MVVISRTYGWVQNPSNFGTLKLVVQIFDPSSQHYAELKNSRVRDLIPFKEISEKLQAKLDAGSGEFTYEELVGTSKGADGKAAKSRKEALANSLIQISVIPQSVATAGKKWTDNWTADGFLRWALSLGFVKHDRDTDICSITELGEEFAKSTLPPEEDPVLISALMSYPPAFRIMQVLSEKVDADVAEGLHFEGQLGWATKFYLGSRLGFAGEKGFTSYPEDLMLEELRNATSAKERNAIRSDQEGSADKYARMIAKWLEKIGYVRSKSTEWHSSGESFSGFQQYSLTAKGLKAFRAASGGSKHKRAHKFINWEFLATAGSTRDYDRTRRAYIIKYLEETKSFTQLMTRLKERGFDDSEKRVRLDIQGLNRIGIQIDFSKNRVDLRDNVEGLSIPDIAVTEVLANDAHTQLKNQIIEATDLPAKFYELVDIAYDSKRNRDFELLAMDFFRTVYNFESYHLGGGRKPDGVAFSTSQAYGLIVDTKAYSSGYGKDIKQEDEMVRYVEDFRFKSKARNATEWWSIVPEHINHGRMYFLWVSSKFNTKFPEQILSTSDRTKSIGGAINVINLLLIGDRIRASQLTLQEFESLLNNSEIVA